MWEQQIEATGVEGPEWENMSCKYVEIHRAVNHPNPGVNNEAQALWLLTDAKENGEDCYEPSGERQSQSGVQVRQPL